MEKQISDTELVNSNMSSRTGSSTEHLKVPTRAKCKVWKYFGFVMNEAGVIVRHTYSLYTRHQLLWKHNKFKLLLGAKAPYNVPNWLSWSKHRNFIMNINYIKYRDIYHIVIIFQVIGDSSFAWWYTSLAGVHLVWRYLRDSPSRQIKATAKYTTYVTGFGETDHIVTIDISRNTDLKYRSHHGSLVLDCSHARFAV